MQKVQINQALSSLKPFNYDKSRDINQIDYSRENGVGYIETESH